MIIDLIKYFETRENYERAFRFLKKDYIPAEAWELLAYLDEVYQSGSCDAVDDWRDLFTKFALENPSNKHLDNLKVLCYKLYEHTDKIDDDVVQMFTNRIFAEQLAEEAIRIAEGKERSFQGVVEVLDSYKRASVKLEKALQEDEQVDWLTSLTNIKTSGMSWSLNSLNKLLGPLNREFIILAARPDGGKTTMLINEAWYLAKQLPEDKCILWFNNEEHISKIQKRMTQSYLGIDAATFHADIITNYHKFQSEFGTNKIILIDDANHISKVERALNKFNPGLIIIDQLYKVQGTIGNKNDVEAERFRKLCEWAREIAKHTAPVIASNQLDGMAEGVRYPPMSMLYGSKTGAQGEADAILFIGKTPVDGDKRFLYTPKNKLTGCSDLFEIELLKDIARFKDV